MSEMTMIKAIRETMRSEMERDPHLFIIGEDVGPYGGEHGVTGDLWKQFGDDRVRDAPISEATIIGCGLGAGMTGCTAISEIPFGDFVGMCMDQIYNQVAKIRYMSGGQAQVNLVIRTTMGGYMGAAAQHSQSLASWFVHTPGLKVVIPSTPANAVGLLRTAIRDHNPIIFFEHKKLYTLKGPVPDDKDYTVPFGAAEIVRDGSDCTVVATSLQVHQSLQAAEELATKGIAVEIIDPRTISPLDEQSVMESLRKTGHLVIVHEEWMNGGYGAEIAARVAERGYKWLRGPIVRVAARDVPIPFSPPMENFVLPQVKDIVAAVERAIA